jgi:hypothetical protein
MNHITIVIPTRNRWQKLANTLDTIPVRSFISVLVVCDGDPETHRRIRGLQASQIRSLLVNRHMGSVYCRNLVIPDCPDGVLYAVDDIEFQPGAIRSALACFNQHFPDDDGVVGFHQIECGDNYHPSGVALLGKRFVDRYPNRQPFCPEYFHFAAQEIHWLAAPCGKFVLCRDAALLHNHPSFVKRGGRDPEQCSMDSTHQDARERAAQDKVIRERRKAAGLVWGDNDE